MLLGTLVHCLVLEKDAFESRFEQELKPDDYPDVIRTVPELKRYCEKHKLATTGVKQELVHRVLEHNPDAPVWDHLLARQRDSKKRIIKTELWDRARRVRDGVFQNDDAALILGYGQAELSCWAEHEPTGQLLKCRADWYRDGVCFDLKTCACSSPSAFAKDCARFGYGLQAAHYYTTLNGTRLDCDLFVFIAVETEPPYLCQVYEVDDTLMELACRRHEQALSDLKTCVDTDTWPGYAESVSTLSLPAWHLKQLENAA